MLGIEDPTIPGRRHRDRARCQPFDRSRTAAPQRKRRTLAKLVQLTISWAGAGVFTDTRALVLSTSFLVLGLQIISRALLT